MLIKSKPSKQELISLIKIYKSSFKVHNILTKKEKDLLIYFKGKEILIAKDKEVLGGLMIKNTEKHKTHKTWKINHLAVSEKHRGKGIAMSLVKRAEKEIKSKSKTAKIEVSVAETEKQILKFWKKLKYKLEGKLRSHYRHKELVYVLGKEL